MSSSGESQKISPSTSERFYKKLLSACPQEFREEHGQQMLQTFGDLYREERHKGRLGFARLWIKTLPDLALTAVLERSRVVATHNMPPWRERINGIDVIIAFALSMALGTAAFALFGSLNPDFWDDFASLSLANWTMLYLLLNLSVVLSIGLMTSVRDTGITTRSIGLRRVPVWWLFVGAALGLVCWTVAGATSAIYFWITDNSLYVTGEEFFPGLTGTSLLELVFFWLAAGLLTALANELLFRGVLYTYLRRWGVGSAVLVSSVAFGLLGFGLNVELFIGIGVGAVLALVYERSGSLWPAVTCVIVINTLGIFFGGLVLL